MKYWIYINRVLVKSILSFPPFDRLKTIDVVIRSTQEAEDALIKFEGQLRNVNKVPSEEKEVKAHLDQLKVRTPTNKTNCGLYLIHCNDLNIDTVYKDRSLSV